MERKAVFKKRFWDNLGPAGSADPPWLTPGFMSRASVDKIAKEIDDVMGKGRYAAQRHGMDRGQPTLPIRASCLRIRIPG